MKQNPWLVVFEGIFLRLRLKTRSAVPQHANLSSAIKHPICPQAWTQSWATYDSGMHITFHFPSRPPHPFFLSPNIRGGAVVPLSQSQTHARVPPSNFSKNRCQWHKQVLAGEHAESEQGRGIYSEITKHFFKAHLLLCNNLLLLFFFLLQINSRERLKTPQLTMRGGRKIPAAGLSLIRAPLQAA